MLMMNRKSVLAGDCTSGCGGAENCGSLLIQSEKSVRNNWNESRNEDTKKTWAKQNKVLRQHSRGGNSNAVGVEGRIYSLLWFRSIGIQGCPTSRRVGDGVVGDESKCKRDEDGSETFGGARGKQRGALSV